jgi:hypothetical protein
MGKGCLAIPQEVGGPYPKWWCTGNCLYLLDLLTTYGNINPLNQLIRDIRCFADLQGQSIPI